MRDIKLTIRLLISLSFCQLDCMNIISKKAIKSMFRTNPGFTHQTVDKKPFSPRRGRIALSANERIAEFLDFAIQAKFAYVGKLPHKFRIDSFSAISRTQKNGQPKPSVSSFCKRSIPVLGSDFILHDVALLELDAIEIVHSARSFRPTPIKNAVCNTRNDQRSKDENSGHIQHPF